MKTHAARRNYQTALGTFFAFVKERALFLVEDVEIDGALIAYWNDCCVQGVQCPGSSASPWFTVSGCHDGSLAVIQLLWVQKTSEVPSMFGWRQLTPARTRRALHQSCDSVHPHFAGDVQCVRASGIEKDRYCPTACATSRGRGHVKSRASDMGMLTKTLSNLG